MKFQFNIEARDPNTNARAGELHSDNGLIETPIFMPVGTQATVKTLSQEELKGLGTQILLGNTYHLYLRPGMEVMESAGGLHSFMNWKMPILTDSGGYQVFSLSDQRKINEEGIVFKSHIDGSKHLFTPQSVIDTQRSLGSDFMMVLDECTPYPCEYNYVKKSIQLTHKWLQEAIEYFPKTSEKYGHEQCLVPIVQGSTYKDLRRESAKFISDTNAHVNAIGGLSVGEPEDELYAMTEVVCEILPKEKPRYLMGVGTPWNLLNCVARGIDMFDCVLPTRNARHGLIYTRRGVINIKNAKWKNNHEAIDAESASAMSRNHSRSYLRHLIHSNEILGARITSMHNISFFLELMKDARIQIKEGSFSNWQKEMDVTLRRKL